MSTTRRRRPARPARPATITGTEIRPGDVITFLGSAHLVDRVDPPSTQQRAMGLIGVARDAAGWGISLDAVSPWATAANPGAGNTWVQQAPR